jgi:hypothetical protein
MNQLRPYMATAVIASSLLLSACGGGGGAGGETGSPNSKLPIDHVSFETTTNQLNMREAENKDFDYVNRVDNGNGSSTHERGYIRIEGSNETDEGTTRDGTVTVEFIDGAGNTFRNVDTYAADAYDADDDQRILITDENGRTIQANGNHEFVVARHQSEMSDSAWSTNRFVYIPAEDKGYVGMAVFGGESSQAEDARIGIFGSRTGNDDTVRQRGRMDYEGNAHGYVSSTGNEFGEYMGDVTARVQFDGVNAPTFSTGGTLDAEVTDHGGPQQLSYAISGDLRSDGTLAANSATMGEPGAQTAAGAAVGGSLYGPNAESMGYVFTLSGDGRTMTGGALLNETGAP